MESLDCLNIEKSGVDYFDLDEFNHYYLLCVEEEKKYRHRYSKEFRKFAKLFIFENFLEFEKQIFNNPENLAEKEIKILWTFVHILQNKALPANHFVPSYADPHIKKRLSQSLSRMLIDFLHIFKSNIKFSKVCEENLLNFNFFSLKTFITDIVFYYAQYILEYRLEEKYDEVYEELTNFVFVDFCNSVENIEQRQEAERVRLLAFYYRVIKDFEKAELYINQYRKIMPCDITQDLSPEIRPKANPSYFSPEDTLENWVKVLDEIVQVQDHVHELTGLYEDTCAYFKCDDCCNHTSPHMSLTEYLYLTKWAEKNHYPLEEAREKANKIQQEHEKQFGESLQIIDKSLPSNKSKGLENPYNYKYSCPFLKDKRCSIYSARPLLCRGFGLSSDDNFAVKTCNFYLDQYTHNCSRDNERYVYDLRPVQTMATESDRYISRKQNLDKKELKGTIVAWLTQGGSFQLPANTEYKFN